jgi:hypothetical protein
MTRRFDPSIPPSRGLLFLEKKSPTKKNQREKSPNAIPAFKKNPRGTRD